MTTQRFFLPAACIDEANARITIDDPRVIVQIRKVLRLKAGEHIMVLDGQGAVYRCCLQSLSEKNIQAAIVKRERGLPEPGVEVTVYLPLLRGGRFEWALEKMTELAVSKIVPVIFSRSVVRTRDSAKLNHWQAVLKEASEQCERIYLPTITPARELSEIAPLVLTTAEPGGGGRFVCAERSDAPLFGPLLHSRMRDGLLPKNIKVIVGPEGGITESEMQLLENCGWQKISLGANVLRAETAAITAVAHIMSIQWN